MRAGYLMLGVVHATGGRSLRWKLAIGSVGLLITLVGDSLALCSTLADFECVPPSSAYPSSTCASRLRSASPPRTACCRTRRTQRWRR